MTLAERLDKLLPNEIFEELTDLLESGDVDDLLGKMSEIDEKRNPQKYINVDSDSVEDVLFLLEMQKISEEEKDLNERI